jgi:subtilisin-like proprotein convertase family protein
MIFIHCRSKQLRRMISLCLLATVFPLSCFLSPSTLLGQAGLRETLEKLDKNENGKIDPDEITPFARPYLERITAVRRMSLRESNNIDKIQEAARIYYAMKNGVHGKEVRSKIESTVKSFGGDSNQPLVPQFGVELKYPYTQDDLDQADRTLRRSDRNEDGYLDREEAARAKWTHRNPFEMDLDKDNRLNRMELTQRYARRRLLRSASGELVQKAQRVGNGIATSSRDEEERRNDSQWWRGGGGRLTYTILGRFDKNRNGRLERNEYQELGIPPSRIDLDKNGELSRDELLAYFIVIESEAAGEDGIPGWFYDLDTNRDRQVSMPEFTTEWTEEKLKEFTSYDANGDGLLTSTEVLESASLVGGNYTNKIAEAIAPRKTIISEIEIEEDYLIGDLNVRLSISHSHCDHLDAYLTGPAGQRIELFTAVGGNDDNFDQTILDDQARDSISRNRPPFRGTFRPEAIDKRQPSLSHFNGKSIKGVWQLVVRGTRSDRFGMLHSWELLAKPQEDLPGTTPPTVPAAEGGPNAAAPNPGEGNNGQAPPNNQQPNNGPPRNEGDRSRGTYRRDDGRKDEGRRDDGRSDEGRRDDGRSDDGRSDDGRSETGRSETGRSETGRATKTYF